MSGEQTTPDGQRQEEPENGDGAATDPGQEHQDDDGGQRSGGDEVAKLRKEAAKYRTRLREVEAERDKLARRVSDYERAEVERQVAGGGGLRNAADFWLAGVSLDDLRDEDGKLDAEKVNAAKKRVVSEHPHWSEPAPDFNGGARPDEQPSAPSFGEAVKQAGNG
jgi:hypothetical protein